MKFLYFSILLLTFISCSEIYEDDENINNFSHLVNLYLAPGSALSSFVDSIQGNIDAINIASLSSPLINYGIGQNSGDDESIVTSAFNINGKASTVDLVKINNSQISVYPNSLPIRYVKSWKSNGLSYGSDIIWEFHQGPSIVKDTLAMPQNFGVMSFSNDKINLNIGGTLYWGNSGSGDVLLTIQYDVFDSTTQKVTVSKIVKSMVIPNNGYYNLSANQLINEFKIPSNATKIDFHLLKANFKTKKYQNDSKQLLNICTVEQWFTIFVN